MNPSKWPILGHTPKFLITLSFAIDTEYNLGNLSANEPSPTHQSSQNLILIPFPHFHLILLLNQLASLLTSQLEPRSFHQYNQWILHIPPMPASRNDNVFPNSFIFRDQPPFLLSHKGIIESLNTPNTQATLFYRQTNFIPSNLRNFLTL